MKKSQDEIFLQTAIIPLEIKGDIFHVRRVLDSSSQTSLIREAAVQRWGKLSSITRDKLIYSSGPQTRNQSQKQHHFFRG